MSVKIPYAVKITNTDLRTFIRKRQMCQCGDVTLNIDGKCDVCKIEDELVKGTEGEQDGNG